MHLEGLLSKQTIISARKRVDRPENTLVELFVVNNKADAALAAGLRDLKTWAAPCSGSRNLDNDVLFFFPTEFIVLD